jgi:Sulfotransferase family
MPTGTIRPVQPLTERVRTLCIGATGQSGSTLLARMVGSLPGFVAVGEVGRIWDKGIQENVECGCGDPFNSCEFWTKVGREAFGSWDEVDAPEATRLRGATTLQQRWAPHAAALPFILHPNLWPGFRRDLEAYAELMERVYRGIDTVTGGRIIVDSMKLAGHVYLASTMPALDVTVAHLTRDPRGYAYSNTKWIERQGAIEGAFRARRTPRKSAIKWMWVNVAFDRLEHRGTPTVRVRYEDLVADPRQTMHRVADVMGVGIDDDALSFIGDGEVELVAQHLVAGSRGRLLSGATPLRRDEDWRTSLPAKDRRTVEAMTWPLRRSHGYVNADEG